MCKVLKKYEKISFDNYFCVFKFCIVYLFIFLNFFQFGINIFFKVYLIYLILINWDKSENDDIVLFLLKSNWKSWRIFFRKYIIWM